MTSASTNRRDVKSDVRTLLSRSSGNVAVPANPFAAFRDVCYRYGIPELADDLGYRRGTLYNKADADAESHNQPTLLDVINVTRVTGDTRILESLDRLFDRAGFRLPCPGECSDEHLIELLCRVGSENGQLHDAVSKALARKRLTVADLQAVRGEAFDLIGEVVAFLTRLEGMVDD